MNSEQLNIQDRHSCLALCGEPMSVKDSRVAPGTLWNLHGEVLLYNSLEKTNIPFEGNRIEHCIIVVIDVVGLRKFGPHSWVHVLAPVGTGYINRVHFNSDGAVTKCI